MVKYKINNNINWNWGEIIIKYQMRILIPMAPKSLLLCNRLFRFWIPCKHSAWMNADFWKYHQENYETHRENGVRTLLCDASCVHAFKRWKYFMIHWNPLSTCFVSISIWNAEVCGVLWKGTHSGASLSERFVVSQSWSVCRWKCLQRLLLLRPTLIKK